MCLFFQKFAETFQNLSSSWLISAMISLKFATNLKMSGIFRMIEDIFLNVVEMIHTMLVRQSADFQSGAKRES